MTIENLLEPLKTHRPGFPKFMVEIINNTTPESNVALIDLIDNTYHQLLEIIDKGLSGKGIKVNEEKVAAEYISHLIIDAEDLWFACKRCGVLVGEFPYKYLVDKLLPEEDKNV